MMEEPEVTLVRRMIADAKEDCAWCIARVNRAKRIRFWIIAAHIVYFEGDAGWLFYHLYYSMACFQVLFLMMLTCFHWMMWGGTIQRYRSLKLIYAAHRLALEAALKGYCDYEEDKE